MSPILILASGQSNCLGRINEGPIMHNENVHLYNNDTNSFEVADLRSRRYRAVCGDYFGDGRANAVVAFANRIQHETGAPVYVVIEAKGGAQIEGWISGVYLQKLHNVINQAVDVTPELSSKVADYFIWLQGEADLRRGMTKEEYGEKFHAVMSQVEAAVKITAPISQGYIENNGNLNKIGVQEFFHSLELPFRVANVDGLTLGDSAHYDGHSVWELGYNRLFQSV